MHIDLSQLQERIEALSAEPDPPPDAAVLQDLLADGYAAALQLEADCARAQRRIDELIAEPIGPSTARDLRRLARARSKAAAQAVELRVRLEMLRRRLEGVDVDVPRSAD